MSEEEIKEKIKNNCQDLPCSENIVEEAVERSERLPLLLFQYLFLRNEKGRQNNWNDPVNSLIASRDLLSRKMLFLVYISRGLFPRDLFFDYLKDSEKDAVGIVERFNRLCQIGLVGERPDGTCCPLFPDHEQSFPEMTDINFDQEKEKFSDYLFSLWKTDKRFPLISFFLFMEYNGKNLQALEVLSFLFLYLLNNGDTRTAQKILNRNFFLGKNLNASEFAALQNILRTARLRLLLLQGDSDLLDDAVTQNTNLLMTPSGLFSEYCLLQQCHYYYSQGDGEKSLQMAKEALFSFQKEGDHYGEAISNNSLAQSLLLMKKVRPAMDYFEIARRISYQINDSYSLIRCSAMQALTFFIYGNLPKALRITETILQSAVKIGWRQSQLLLQFLKSRILFELGDYQKALDFLKEGEQTSRYYNYEKPADRFLSWQARCVSVMGKTFEADEILNRIESDREILFFKAENAYNRNDIHKALDLIEKAAAFTTNKTVIMGENDDWSDGYRIIEGRLSSLHNREDTLKNQITAFLNLLRGLSGEYQKATEGFSSLCRKGYGLFAA